MDSVCEKTSLEVSLRSLSTGPEQVLDYLGLYTHRIAITNHRIKSIENEKVTFSYKDRKTNETKTMSLNAMEFIRRFLLHVLPNRFMKIRHYGFLANICKKKAILLIRRLIGKAMEMNLADSFHLNNSNSFLLRGKETFCKIFTTMFQ